MGLTKFINRYTSTTSDKLEWRMTDDGFLRCTARVLQSKVLVFNRDEVQRYPDGFSKDEVSVFVPTESLAEPESLTSLEGVPVVAWDHSWTSPSNVRGVSVGNVAGSPSIDGEFLVCDLLITDNETIQQIQSGDIGEISAAYYADTIFEPGTFRKEPFDAEQRCLRYNHVAIIPVGRGRAGKDVRIINVNANSKAGEHRMQNETKLVRVPAYSKGRFLNMDEPSATVYADEAKDFASMQASLDTMQEKEQDLEVLRKRCSELEGELSVYKQKMEAMGDDSAIEKAAEEMLADQKDASEMIKNEKLVGENGTTMDAGEIKKYENSISSIHGDKLRASVLKSVGVNIGGMSPEAIKGAWSAKLQIKAMQPSQMQPSQIVSGQKIFNEAAAAVSSQQPIQHRYGYGP